MGRIPLYDIDKSVLVFSGKQTTRLKAHTKLHPGLEWYIFHILTSEGIDDVIFHSYTVVCSKIFVYIIKKKLHGGLNFIFSWYLKDNILPLENKISIFALPCYILYLLYRQEYFSGK